MTQPHHCVPLIGLSSTLKDGLLGLRPQYASSVSRAGGMPVLLPIDIGEDALMANFDVFDGILLSGGADVDPRRYGEAPSAHCGEISLERDAAEFRLLEAAQARGLPVFGICRGMQVMNVYRGGTLAQDIPDELGVPLERHRQTAAYEVLTHEVDVTADTRLSQILGGSARIGVNSMHHQAVKRLGRGLTVNAVSAEDGIVEAFDDPTADFFFAVQWHPEMLSHEHEAARRLFESFVSAAAAHRARRMAR